VKVEWQEEDGTIASAHLGQIGIVTVRSQFPFPTRSEMAQRPRPHHTPEQMLMDELPFLIPVKVIDYSARGPKIQFLGDDVDIFLPV
jgi:hypothetical protein